MHESGCECTECVMLFGAEQYCCEYYCQNCKQLRLWLRDRKVERCGNCQSSDIVVDSIGSEKLKQLRYGQ